MNELLWDLRYGFRTLMQSPGFTIVAVLTLAIGIGANTAIFSFVDGVLLKPLPYAEPERIMRVLEKPPGGGYNGISTLNYLDWQKDNTVFEYMAAQTWRLGDPHRRRMSPSSFAARRCRRTISILFGIQPALGRTFAAGRRPAG